MTLCFYFPLFPLLFILFLSIYYTFLFKTMYRDRHICWWLCVWAVNNRWIFFPLSFLYLHCLLNSFLIFLSSLFPTWLVSLFYGYNVKPKYILIYRIYLQEFVLSVVFKWLLKGTKLTYFYIILFYRPQPAFTVCYS